MNFNSKMNKIIAIVYICQGRYLFIDDYLSQSWKDHTHYGYMSVFHRAISDLDKELSFVVLRNTSYRIRPFLRQQKVKSLFKSKWIGTYNREVSEHLSFFWINDLNQQNKIVNVTLLEDKRGNPIKNKIKKDIAIKYLEVVEEEI